MNSNDLVNEYNNIKSDIDSLKTEEIQSKTRLEQTTEEYKAELSKIKEDYEIESVEKLEGLKETKLKALQKTLPEIKGQISKYKGGK